MNHSWQHPRLIFIIHSLLFENWADLDTTQTAIVGALQAEELDKMSAIRLLAVFLLLAYKPLPSAATISEFSGNFTINFLSSFYRDSSRCTHCCWKHSKLYMSIYFIKLCFCPMAERWSLSYPFISHQFQFNSSHY